MEESYPYEVRPAESRPASMSSRTAVENAIDHYEMRLDLLEEEGERGLLLWIFDLTEMRLLRDALADATDARLIAIHHQVLAALDSVDAMG